MTLNDVDRQYCTRRLRRIYKGVKFLHGRKHYQKRQLAPDTVADIRHLHIPLVSAERAWACAMDIKNQIEQGAAPNMRHHLIRRLAKAHVHAQELAILTAKRCDSRTALEAEAYEAWMSGNLLLEKENDWAATLKSFVRAKNVLEELARLGSFDQQSVCRHFLDQIEPTIRYCAYHLSRQEGAAAPDVNLLLGRTTSGPLSTKLADLTAEAKADTIQGVTELEWAGGKLPVRNDKVRSALQTAMDISREWENAKETSVEERVAFYDRLSNAYNEVAAAAHAILQLGLGSSVDAEEKRLELMAIERASKSLAFQMVMKRQTLMIHDAKSRFSDALFRLLTKQKLTAGIRERPAKAEDLVRLHNAALQTIQQLNELAAEIGGAAGEHLMGECMAMQALHLAGRCLYVAHSFLAANKNTEALALFGRAVQRCKQAQSKIADWAQPDSVIEAEVQAIQDEATAFELVASAEIKATELRAAKGMQEGMQSMSLLEGKEEGVGNIFLEDSMDQWESFFSGGVKEVPRIARLPPLPQAVPVRPIFLDTALDRIRAPSLDHRVPKKQKVGDQQSGGVVSRLFGW